MSSINTNVAAMTALKSLQMTNASLEKTQNAISTGYRVADSKDNAAYWSIATTMRSDNKALGTVQDALGLGAAKLDTTYTGLNAAIDVVDEIKAKLVAAREPGVDKAKVQAEISELQSNLTSIATAASFSGENWLSVDSGAADYSGTKDVVASFNRASDGSVSVGTISIDITSTELFDADDQSGILDTTTTTTGGGAVTVSVSTLDITAANIDDTDMDELISHVDSALQDMTTAAADIGSAAKRVDLQTDFIGNLMNAIDRGIGQLVDADMSEESTKLQALQTQQQLGIQALAIANAGAQSILSLFR
ncbi:flagellin [Salaquimonas pukyongi]|uniref:flagellin N-terminal helical domain-containing protein n=1 Tax=Salaquimonas pukyongi TaxID=2712698 RepID=UPI00096B6968|nr:flagellin [Salaquimonas pukyongi]